MILEPEPTELNPYHNGRSKIRDKPSPAMRRFIAWDGEGLNLDGPHAPQHYILFGCSTGDYISGTQHLTTFDLLNFICDIGDQNPNAFHVGFAFGYDGNMILRSLARSTLEILHRTGYVRLKRPDLNCWYGIKFIRGKWFHVTREFSDGRRSSVRIDDMFSFFTTKFTVAYQTYLGRPVPSIVEIGKGDRNREDRTLEDMPDILAYWQVEIQCMRELAEELRRNVYGAGLIITNWHGPGSLASYVMKRKQIKRHMKVNDEKILLAARYAYAGGRFELFRVGRFLGPVYSYDINSAYPFGISQLPSLSDGEWTFESTPDRIARFGVYHVRLRKSAGFNIRPGPVFHRDARHEISFPWYVDGWCWGPEAHIAKRLGAKIVEGYHYTGSQIRPFEWVRDMYQTRLQWKYEKKPSHLALKPALNSLCGKMAQRVGWDEKRKRIPPFHQLEWAGWVTANTRATLYEVLAKIPSDQLIAVETDGLYTTVPPDVLGIEVSDELGGWKITEYAEVLYLQSGLAWFRCDDTCKCDSHMEGKWNDKRRGLDVDSFSLNDCSMYLRELRANETWNPFVGRTKRFTGLGAALNSSAPLKMTHCRWVSTPREISPGKRGKRIHVSSYCDACEKGASAYELPHTLVTHPNSARNPISHPHSIPWENPIGHTAWRELQDYGLEVDIEHV